MDITILIVDDNEANRALLGYLCNAAGYRVVFGVDAPSGFAAAQRERPDLALIDVMMPGGGLNLARRLRALPTLAGTPMIAISAGPKIREEAIEAGFDDFISIPAEPEAIIGLVASRLTSADAPNVG